MYASFKKRNGITDNNKIMKKIFGLMATAVATLALTACFGSQGAAMADGGEVTGVRGSGYGDERKNSISYQSVVVLPVSLAFQFFFELFRGGKVFGIKRLFFAAAE